MNVYIWNDHHSRMAIAHANTVKEARDMLLDEIWTTDGSCPVRNELIRAIKSINPTIFRGNVCEFAIDEGSGVHFS